MEIHRIAIMVAVAASVAVVGCDSDFMTDPPVAVTMRTGVLSELVLQVNNLTTKAGIEVYVYAANDCKSARSGNVVIPANSSREFGSLEMNWRFSSGDRGFVAIRRHPKKLFFEILENGRYRTWFGLDDIPEIDVAAELREKKAAEHMAWLNAATSTNAIFGRELFVAIATANVERDGVGLPSIWPRSQGGLKERAKDAAKAWKEKIAAKLKRDAKQESGDKDIADIKFGSATDYFNVLLDMHRKGTDAWAPYVALSNGIGSVSISSAKEGDALVAKNIRWSILADADEELSDCIPVLVSANFPCEKLRSAWDGKECAGEVIALSAVGDMKDEAFVVVYKNGEAKVISAANATLGNIYSGPFNTCTNGYNKALYYLTPSGIENAVDVSLGK